MQYASGSRDRARLSSKGHPRVRATTKGQILRPRVRCLSLSCQPLSALILSFCHPTTVPMRRCSRMPPIPISASKAASLWNRQDCLCSSFVLNRAISLTTTCGETKCMWHRFAKAAKNCFWGGEKELIPLLEFLLRGVPAQRAPSAFGWQWDWDRLLLLVLLQCLWCYWGSGGGCCRCCCHCGHLFSLILFWWYSQLWYSQFAHSDFQVSLF